MNPSAKIRLRVLSFCQSLLQLLVSAANHNELEIERTVSQPLGNLEHHVRTLTAKQHQPGRKIRVEPQAFAFHRAVAGLLFIELGPQNHATRTENVCIVVPQGARLRDGSIGSANKILLLLFDPKVRRIVGKIGQNRHEWHAWRRLLQTLKQRPVKVRND